MIGEVIRERLEFGVILASEKGIVNTGCTAMIDKVLREYPGRAHGHHRARAAAL